MAILVQIGSPSGPLPRPSVVWHLSTSPASSPALAAPATLVFSECLDNTTLPPWSPQTFCFLCRQPSSFPPSANSHTSFPSLLWHRFPQEVAWLPWRGDPPPRRCPVTVPHSTMSFSSLVIITGQVYKYAYLAPQLTLSRKLQEGRDHVFWLELGDPFWDGGRPHVATGRRPQLLTSWRSPHKMAASFPQSKQSKGAREMPFVTQSPEAHIVASTLLSSLGASH